MGASSILRGLERIARNIRCVLRCCRRPGEACCESECYGTDAAQAVPVVPPVPREPDLPPKLRDAATWV